MNEDALKKKNNHEWRHLSYSTPVKVEACKKKQVHIQPRHKSTSIYIHIYNNCILYIY